MNFRVTTLQTYNSKPVGCETLDQLQLKLEGILLVIEPNSFHIT